MRVSIVAVAVCLSVTGSVSRSLGQCCGDCDGNGMVTINELIAAVNNALGQCESSGCSLPVTGQTSNWGVLSDGNVQAGAPRSFTDNGDGTISDNATGLMWEKKSNDGSIHDKDNAYTWALTMSPNILSGTIVTVFLQGLNGSMFAGHRDWRIPNITELQSLVNYQIGSPGPVVYPAFNAGCVANCTVRECSCTQSDYYWSSTTYQGSPGIAWPVNFGDGLVFGLTKNHTLYVRAVRGGS